MKKIIRYTAITFFTLSCNIFLIEEPSPTVMHYNFISPEGGDFFDNNARYSIDKLTAYDDKGDDTGLTLGGNLNGFNFFWIYRWQASPIFLKYGNGDIDTLVTEYEPKDVHPYADFEELDRVRFYFNGKLITDWDFSLDPHLKDSIVDHNFPMGPRSTPVPVIIIKEENPDELKGG